MFLQQFFNKTLQYFKALPIVWACLSAIVLFLTTQEARAAAPSLKGHWVHGWCDFQTGYQNTLRTHAQPLPNHGCVIWKAWDPSEPAAITTRRQSILAASINGLMASNLRPVPNVHMPMHSVTQFLANQGTVLTETSRLVIFLNGSCRVSFSDLHFGDPGGSGSPNQNSAWRNTGFCTMGNVLATLGGINGMVYMNSGDFRFRANGANHTYNAHFDRFMNLIRAGGHFLMVNTYGGATAADMLAVDSICQGARVEWYALHDPTAAAPIPMTGVALRGIIIYG